MLDVLGGEPTARPASISNRGCGGAAAGPAAAVAFPAAGAAAATPAAMRGPGAPTFPCPSAIASRCCATGWVGLNRLPVLSQERALVKLSSSTSLQSTSF